MTDLATLLRANVEAVRAEVTRAGAGSARAAALAARERLVNRADPLPERAAALDRLLAPRLEELGGGPETTRAAGDSPCDILFQLAATSFEIADTSPIFSDIDDFTGLGYLFLGAALDCLG